MIFMPIALLLLVATGILLYQNNTQNRSLESKDVALENLQQELTAKDTEIKALTQSKEDLIKQVAQTAVAYDGDIALLKQEIATLKDSSYSYPDYVLSALVDHGFASPSALLETLKEHHDLIKIDGVLGGTMRWWPENSVLINEKYVFGYFEDGHIMGYALLAYSFGDDRVPKWEVINTYMQ